MSETSEDITAKLYEGIVEYPKRWSGDTHSDKGGRVDYMETERLMTMAADEILRLRAERSAAPDMAEALEKILAISIEPNYRGDWIELDVALTYAKRALAKARGTT